MPTGHQRPIFRTGKTQVRGPGSFRIVYYVAIFLLSCACQGRLKINLELTGYDQLIKELNEKINDVILMVVACVLFSGGCKLAATDIKPLTASGMPVISLIVLVISISLGVYTLKRVFRKK